MKYEAVFGDQRLFDGAPEEATHAVKGGGFYNIENMSVKYVSYGIFNGTDVLSVGGYLIAERRIIAEPKRWTVEDQKAGRLPEVGCRIYVPIMFEEQNVIYSSEKVIVSISDNGGAVTRTEVASINRIKPIETPEEKAQREEDEFISSLSSVDIHDGTVSGFFNQGARAAYRKLKGGE